jgi:cation:H+ antiporter
MSLGEAVPESQPGERLQSSRMLAFGEPGSLVGTDSTRARRPDVHPGFHLPPVHASVPSCRVFSSVRPSRSVTVAPAVVVFVLGAVVSLATSWVLVARLERVGERLGFSEAALGIVAALAADTPEITASVTALAHHQQSVGAGVVLGSNVFNLAALLGLGAVVAGRIALHRKVVLFSGTVAMVIAVACLLSVGGQISAGVGLGVVLLVLLAYVTLLSAHRKILSRAHLPELWSRWLTAAIEEEESELEEAIRPQRGTNRDVLVAAGALVVVALASVAMEQGATNLGVHFGIPEIVVGGLILAAVTSLPNAVSAVYLAQRGRGAAALSTALNSNSLNVAAGLLIPAVVIGLAQPSDSGLLVASWYVGLTAVTLVLAYVRRGLGRVSGAVIIVVYFGFVAALLRAV